MKIGLKGKEVMINAAKVVTVDIEAGNGVIRMMDSVIMPPSGKKKHWATSFERTYAWETRSAGVSLPFS